MSNHHRLTLVACSSANPIDWSGETRLAFLGGGAMLREEVTAALTEPTLDAERLILDCAASAEAFLDVLASLPSEFSGDAMWIDARGGGFISATGRGGDRVLYRLQPDDVHFYLAMHGLIAAAETLEKIA